MMEDLINLPGPKGALGPLGPLKKSLRSGIHARNPPQWSATPFISCPEPPKMGGEAAHFCFSGHAIKCVADHFGGFRAWIPERSDFFKGPKGPKAPLGPLKKGNCQVRQPENCKKLTESWLKVDQNFAEIINTTIRMGRASRAPLGLLFFVFRQTFGQLLANFRPTFCNLGVV